MYDREQKWRWTGHVARMNDNRWTNRITNWCPYNDKRSKKRPDTRKICGENLAKNSSG